jgi:serine/threonine protein kinase
MLSQPNPSAPRFLGPEFEAHWLSGVPEEVKNLVELMVAPNPTLRPSCKVLLSHPWLKGLI